MNSQDLLSSHRYAEAIEEYQQVMRHHPEQNYHGGMGRAFLALGEFDRAIESFKNDNAIESGRVKGNLPSLPQVGVALWLKGERPAAMSEWHRAAAGILDGSIKYADAASGATQGLLLWYGAVTLKAEADREYALKYLRNRVERKGYALRWPRPVAQMVLGDRSLCETLEMGSGSPELSVCLEKAKLYLLQRRRLCQTVFYTAVLARQAGDETECRKKMGLCSELENPILEPEWYLARSETATAPL